MNKTDLTGKQAKALQNVVGNGGNVKQAMLDAGYSPNTANTPSKLTNSPTFKKALKTANQKLAIKYDLTMDEAYKIIAEAKGAKRLIVHNGSNANEGWTEEVPDYTTRLKVASMIMKIHELSQNDQPANELTPGLTSALIAINHQVN
jgi:phage terminase small subunit